MLCLKAYDKENKLLAVARGEEEVSLVMSRAYQEGGRLSLESSGNGSYIWLQFDDALGKSLCYVTGVVDYTIPFGDRRINVAPKAFSGNKHLLYARLAKDYEIKAYRNLALNVNDQHGDGNCYPHASANVETRGEAVFAAKNAIDGIVVNSGHGEWPYQSWGINRDPNAAMKLDFGRKVKIDRVVLYTRADFPHDSWWTNATLTFSDGSTMELPMEKSVLPHEFSFEPKEAEWLELSKLIKSDDPSPFPALSQIEVYGTDI